MAGVVDTKSRVRGPLIVWDLGVSVILMILGIALAAFLMFSALLLIMSSDSCGSSTQCNSTQLTAGWIVAMAFPVVAVVASIVIGLVLIVKRRVSFWVPIAGAAVAIAGWFAGVLLVFGSVPGFRP